MSDNSKMIVLGAVAVMAFLVMNKTQARPAAQVRTPQVQPGQTQNLNGQMWQSLQGNDWTRLLSGAVNRNPFGQQVTSNGVPVMTKDVPAAIWGGYGSSVIDYGTEFGVDGKPYIDSLFPLIGSLDWQL